MKHHFADMLDRSGGHWTITPNVERRNFHFQDIALAPEGCTNLTVTKWDQNWELMRNFTELQELTLHEPSKDQLLSLPKLKKLKRLRISHARSQSLDFLLQFQAVEELVLEYVSGTDSLKPLAQLPNLKALHIENMKRVHDFSDLADAKGLEYLSIDGTFDWKQPIDKLDFLSHLKKLEHFRLWYVRVADKSPVLKSLKTLTKLKKVVVCEMTLPLEDYAWLQAILPNVQGTVFAPYKVTPAENRMITFGHKVDKVTLEQVQVAYPKALQGEDGEFYESVPEYTFFLGLNAGTVKGESESALQRRADYSDTYNELIQKFRSDSERVD